MSLEYKKVKAELAAVIAAKYDLEFRLEQARDTMERISHNIQIQIQKEEELDKKLKEME
jgi:phage shock protein A